MEPYMSNLNELREDLDFVAGAVRRGQKQSVPSILALWAVLVPIGYALVDFAPQYSGLYWLIAGIGGGIASGLLGRQATRRSGLRDDDFARRVAAHWVTVLAAFLLFGIAVGTGHMDGVSTAPVWLLIAAIAYVMAGIHLDRDRAMLPSGLIMVAGFAVLVWVPLPYPWTITGLLVSASLILAAVRSARAPGLC
jgi:hypothetical protein